MNVPLPKDAHIAIRYAIMHAYKGNLDPNKKDYTIQMAPKCHVCGGSSTAFGVECTEMHDVDPGDHMFHYVCSVCFTQLVICTDHVSYCIANVGYIDSGTGEVLYNCTESQYQRGTDYLIKGEKCDKDIYLNYLAKMREVAFANRDKCIADSEKYFHVEKESIAKPNFPLN